MNGGRVLLEVRPTVLNVFMSLLALFLLVPFAVAVGLGMQLEPHPATGEWAVAAVSTVLLFALIALSVRRRLVVFEDGIKMVNMIETRFFSWGEIDAVSWTIFKWIDFSRSGIDRRALAILPHRGGWLNEGPPQTYACTATTLQSSAVRDRIVRVLRDLCVAHGVRFELEPSNLKGRDSSSLRGPASHTPPPDPYRSG